MNRYDVLIIGGGAAGLFAAAIFIKEFKRLNSLSSAAFPKVAILERNSLLGKKIGITGKGRCNLTNTKDWNEFSKHVHPNSNFFRAPFHGMTNIKTIEFFNEIGLGTVVERGDRVFPTSMRAHDVTAALANFISDNGVEILTSTYVSAISKNDDLFCVNIAGSKSLLASNLVVATGGLSYPVTGSDGSGYEFAKALGHSITTLFPSLTAVVPKNYSEIFHGISLKNVSVRLVVNGSVLQEEFGDLDFTNGGIEGPIGFKVSRKAVWNILNGQKVKLFLDMKPAVEPDKLLQRVEREGINNLNALLPKLLPKALIKPFCDTNKDLSLSNLCYKLKNWEFDIVDYVGYKRAVVTAGGVSLKEVSKKSMESQIVPGLYMVGEVLDIDADTGGYNLQVAFSTAASAAIHLAKKFNL